MADDKPKHIEGVGWRHETDTTRHHRENLWDYKGRAIYHITLATEGRQPIFGTLTGESEEEAFVVYSRLGEYVDKTFRGLPDFYAKKGVLLKVLAVRIMPEHMHGVIQVLEPMPKSIGEVVRSFKSACTSWYKREVGSQEGGCEGSKESCGNNATEVHKLATEVHKLAAEGQKLATEGQKVGEEVRKPGEEVQKAGEEVQKAGEEVRTTAKEQHGSAEVVRKLEERLVHFGRIFAERGSIWEYMPAGYHERILHCEGQLDRMIRYVKDNPRRLWLKQHRPELFRLHNDLTWEFRDAKGKAHTWRFRALGNMFLLDFPMMQHIQCSRSITDEELEQKCLAWQRNAQHGVVSVTSAISKGEKSVSRRLREGGMPLIVMLKDGFPPVGSPHERYFKPGGVYFDACAAGRLLLIEPYSEVLDDPMIVEAVFRKSPMATRNSLRYHFLALNKVGEMMSTIS